ncbi:hypothetical protein ACQ4PT_030628 [Festuca glaucescens]
MGMEAEPDKRCCASDAFRARGSRGKAGRDGRATGKGQIGQRQRSGPPPPPSDPAFQISSASPSSSPATFTHPAAQRLRRRLIHPPAAGQATPHSAAMDSDDEEMCDAYTASVDDAGYEESRDGLMVMEVRWFEVDLDYEYDAPRWFDLAQEEAPVEAAAAEMWFATAPSYPPSPLIAMMLAEDLGLSNLRSIAVAEIDAVHSSKPLQGCSGAADQSMYQSHVPTEGRIPCYGISKNERKPAARSIVKGNLSKGSTLMKPTASQLARQNRQPEVKNVMPSKKSVGVRSETSTMSSNDCTNQAGKRQKLEKGHLNKNVMNSCSDHATGLPKLKITVPREPELATKLRAESIDRKPEDSRDGTFKFRAQRLDKKILPSKGDTGLFQNAKRNPTVPKEFNLSTCRKSKQAPLSELFNKLSLTTEARRAMDRQAAERPNYITTKDCKENMIGAIRC